jgi:histidyl-tRNA synthetase
MLDTIRATFELFGFSPIETSSLQREEVLTGGDENFKKQIFAVSNTDDEDSTLALRFDLTVPMARLVSSSGDKIERPFKRYEIGKVWRGEKAQAGRYREFLQCDADIVGSASPLSDAEIISLIYETMRALGLENFFIKINSRAALANLDQNQIRILDKLDKIGEDKVREELERAGVTKKIIDDTLNGVFMNQVKEIDGVIEYAESLGVPKKFMKKDPTLARGLGYYTGIVFEAVLSDMPEVGSVFGGGRYDNLVEQFGGSQTPAVGVSVGIDRLFTALDKKDLIKGEKKPVKVLVLNFDNSCTAECLKIVSDLRKEKIGAEIYFGKEETLKGQLSFAVKNEYEVVVIVGQQEKERGIAQIKNMVARTQEETILKNVSITVKNILNS